MKRVWSGVLPKSGKTFTARVQTGAEEDRIAKMAGDIKDTLSMLILSRLVSLGDSSPVTIDEVKALGLMDRKYLRDEFKSHEGDLDNEVDVTCPVCKNEFKTDINVGTSDFFFPTAT
jgi:hypothetical protein